jgi:transposase
VARRWRDQGNPPRTRGGRGPWGVPNQTLYGWLAKAKPGSPSPVATGVVETPEEEARRLRRELADVTQERDFLKKAAAFFAKLNT